MVLYSEQGHDPTSTCCSEPRDAVFRLDFGLLIAVRLTLIELSQERKCMCDRERRALQVQNALSGWRGKRQLPVGREPLSAPFVPATRDCPPRLADRSCRTLQRFYRMCCAGRCTKDSGWLTGCGIWGRAGREEAKRLHRNVRLGE
jgi:hypothetical protein